MMRKTFLVSFFVLVRANGAFADDTVLDCGKKSLAEAVQNVTSKNAAISFTGVCAGPIVIATDGVTLKGLGTPPGFSFSTRAIGSAAWRY